MIKINIIKLIRSNWFYIKLHQVWQKKLFLENAKLFFGDNGQRNKNNKIILKIL
jgi:hypothetical protein